LIRFSVAATVLCRSLAIEIASLMCSTLQIGILNTAPADVLQYLHLLVLILPSTIIPFTPVHSAVLMMAPKLRQIFDLILKQWFLPFSITDSIND
jgi:hypothetical protein